MGVCDVPGVSYVCDAVGDGVATLVSAPFDWLASAMGSAAGWVFEQVWTVFDTTTMVDVTNSGYRQVYALVFGAACFLMLILFCFQLVAGLIRHEPAALGRAATGLAKSVLGSFLVLAVTGLLLEATDQLCVGIVQATGNTMESMGGRIAVLAAGLTAINIAAPGVGAIITIFLAGLAITSALVVWFSLLVRKALLLVAVVFGPFATAGWSWDATKGWFSKWAMFVIAMILSKLVLVVTLLVAVTQTASPIDPDLQSVSEPVAGVVLMMIAAFAPYMSYKFISFMGADMYHLMSAEREAKSAMNRPIPARPQASNPSNILGGNGTSSSSTGGGGSTPPPASPSAGSGGGSASAGASSGGAAAGGSASAGASSAGAGASSGGAAAGGAAAAGPAAAVIIGAQVVKGAATAGPKAGGGVGGAATGQTDAAQATPPTAPATTFTPTSSTPPPPEPPAPAPQGA